MELYDLGLVGNCRAPRGGSRPRSRRRSGSSTANAASGLPRAGGALPPSGRGRRRAARHARGDAARGAGQEGCHWTFRRAQKSDWPKLVQLLLGGRSVRATEAVGWLCDFAGPLEPALATAWKIASGGDHRVNRRKVEAGALAGVPSTVAGLPEPDGATQAAARKAIMDTVQAACSVPLAEAIAVQARHSGAFMTTPACLGGAIGADFQKTMKI